MNAPQRIYDSFVNLLNGIAGPNDKVAAQRYFLNPLDAASLEMAYRSDWIARKVVDIPALDSTREWRAWQAEDDQIEKIEEVERSLNIQRKVTTALIKARLYGGAGLILGIKNDSNPQEELDLERIREGDLHYIHVATRYQLRVGQVNRDLLSPFFGEPEYYEVSSTDKGIVRIHPSRIIRLIGSEVPNEFSTTEEVWGDSVLQVVDDAIKAAGLVSNAGAQLVSEAKMDIIKIPNFTRSVRTPDYRENITARFNYANSHKSILNALLLDKEEEWNRVTSNFAGLPEILRMYLLIASGAADIPATRLLGQSAVGLNATGESDIRNYYDRVRVNQTTYLEPVLARLDEVIVRSALGSRPDDVWYNWNSLWQLDDVEKADLAAKKAGVFKIDADTGALPESALREARQNQLIEDGFYPGLEAALEKAEQEEDDGVDEDELRAQILLEMQSTLPPPPAQRALPPGTPSQDARWGLPFRWGRVRDDRPREPDGRYAERWKSYLARVNKGRRRKKREEESEEEIAEKENLVDAFFDWLLDRDWDESQVERDEKGRFGSGGGGSESLSKAPSDRSEWPSHIQDLKIPPAWTDVRINSDPDADLMAIGKDSKGRSQYVYSKKFADSQAAAKFQRIRELRDRRADIISKNNKNVKAGNPNAEVTAVIMATGIRPGSDQETGAKVKAYGATTLEGRHVVTDGDSVRLQFTGKKGVAIDIEVSDRQAASILKSRAEKSGADGQLFPEVSPGSLLDYTKEVSGGPFKTKDFRTMVGTETAVSAMAKMDKPKNESSYKKAVKDVAKQVASQLGNTPTVALASYIDPTVFSEWRSAAGL